jgi:hypothetical protein
VGKAISPLGKIVSPVGKERFPAGEDRFPAGKQHLPDRKLDFPRGTAVARRGKFCIPALFPRLLVPAPSPFALAHRL